MVLTDEWSYIQRPGNTCMAVRDPPLAVTELQRPIWALRDLTLELDALFSFAI